MSIPRHIWELIYTCTSESESEKEVNYKTAPTFHSLKCPLAKILMTDT